MPRDSGSSVAPDVDDPVRGPAASITYVLQVFASVFVDFGDNFVTSDANGEAVKECMLNHVSNANPAVSFVN